MHIYISNRGRGGGGVEGYLPAAAANQRIGNFIKVSGKIAVGKNIKYCTLKRVIHGGEPFFLGGGEDTRKNEWTKTERRNRILYYIMLNFSR